MTREELTLKYGPDLELARADLRDMVGRAKKWAILMERFGRDAHHVATLLHLERTKPTRWDRLQLWWLVKRKVWTHRLLLRLEALFRALW